MREVLAGHRPQFGDGGQGRLRSLSVRCVAATAAMAARDLLRAAAMLACSASNVVSRSAHSQRPQRRPGGRVLALVVVGELIAEIRPRSRQMSRAPLCPGGKASSAVTNRSRSRRTAPWMALFMLSVTMAGTVNPRSPGSQVFFDRSVWSVARSRRDPDARALPSAAVSGGRRSPTSIWQLCRTAPPTTASHGEPFRLAMTR